MAAAYISLTALALVLPLVLVTAALFEPLRRGALALGPLSALPALALGLVAAQPYSFEVPDLLLGTMFGLDNTTRVFLLFTAALWTIAGLYTRSYIPAGRAYAFWGFYQITLAGNLGLILSQDVPSFYLFFTVMSFAAYGLVVNDGSERAYRAGRVYLILVVIGEALLLPALMIAASEAPSFLVSDVAAAVATSENRDLILALGLAGFGVKAGALPLHLWLPLAHPAAPTPASAVLSGTMIKAGLLGWIQLAPAGEASLPVWGTIIMAFGLVAVFYGVLVGITQTHPKAVLAYSSISQMGLMTLALGAGLASEETWPLALAAILAYAAHHALVKGSLFLGVGIAEHAGTRLSRRLTYAGLIFAALVIAGAPLTAGSAAKETLKAATDTSATLPPVLLEGLIQFGAVGTTVLLARFLWSLAREEVSPGDSPAAGLWLPWAVLLAGVAGMVFLIPYPAIETLSFTSVWPVALGTALAAGAWLLGRRGFLRAPYIPEGDLLLPATAALSGVARLWTGGIAPRWESGRDRLVKRYQRRRERVSLRERAAWLEGYLRTWLVAGTLFALLIAAVILSATLG